MYLQKMPSGVFHFRKAMPRDLTGIGYPCHIKISLLTKDRSLAISRNLDIAKIVHELLARSPEASYHTFKSQLDSRVDALRREYGSSGLVRVTAAESGQVHATYSRLCSMQDALDRFIDDKSQAGLRALTVTQLSQRIGHFVAFSGNNVLASITRSHLHAYVSELVREGRSAKTNKEYVAAVKQWLCWCTERALLKVNPASGFSAQFRAEKLARDSRERWTTGQLDTLFSSELWKSESDAFQWVTLLVLLMGMRPAEACQLRSEDIVEKEGITCVRVTDAGTHMRVKSPHAVRDIPLHTALLEQGFVDWMQSAKQTHLYHEVPQGEVDWSRPFLVRFGQFLDTLGLQAGARPTAYGLRHTFIDCLKQEGISEAVVADIVGHSVPSLTYGRYGKRTPLAQMQAAINSMTLSAGGVYASA